MDWYGYGVLKREKAGNRRRPAPTKPPAARRSEQRFGLTDPGPDGMVLRYPLALIPSSPGTTSSGPEGIPADPTWCFTARKALFLRRRAPRLRGRIGFRWARRGASLPAKPCFFVAEHHVFGAGWGSGRPGMVLPYPPALIPSSPGTTSSGPDGVPVDPTWCFPPRQPLFLRRRAPRPASQ